MQVEARKKAVGGSSSLNVIKAAGQRRDGENIYISVYMIVKHVNV